MNLRALMPVAFAGVYGAIPLFPAFIALTSVAYPGVSLLPAPLVFALLGFVGIVALYAGTVLLCNLKRGSQPLLLPMVAWFAASMLAALAGFNPAAGLLFVGIFGLGVVWHCSLLRFYRDRNVSDAIFWAYLLSGTLAAASAIVMVVTRRPAALYTIGHGRAIGTFILPGELAAYLVVFLPIAYAIARTGARRALRVLASGALIVGLAALALSYSRAGWMGFAAAAGFLAAVRLRRLRHGALAIAVAACGGIAAVLMLFNAHHNPSEDYTRLSIWRAALQVIDRFPLTGVGPFDFERLYAIVRAPDADAMAFHAHSLYLTFFAELGILGLAAFLWTGWAFARELVARVSRMEPRAALLSLACAAGLVGVAVQGLIDTMSIVIFGLWLPTLGLGLAAAGEETSCEESTCATSG